MRRRDAVWSLVFMLAACGGGGGGGDDGTAGPPPVPPPPPPAPPPPAPAPFALAAADPSDGSAGVARDAVLEAGFNADVDAGTISSASVEVFGPEGNLLAFDLDVNGATVIAAARLPLPGHTGYTLRIDASVADTQGRTLGRDERIRFTTAAQAWAPTAVDVGNMPDHTGKTFPNIVALSSGGAMLVSRIVGGIGSSLAASRRDAATGTWSPLVVVRESDPAFANLGPPSLVAGPDGDALLFWTEQDAAGWKVVGARCAASSDTWTAIDGIPDVQPAFIAGMPIAAMDSRGNTTLLLQDVRSMYATRLDAGTGVWSVPQRIDIPATSSYLLSVRISVDAQDAVVAAWIQEIDGRGREVCVSRQAPDSATWSAAEAVGPSAMQYMAMGVDEQGEVTLAWASPTLIVEPSHLWVTQGRPGQGAWTSPQRLDTDSVFGVGVPALAVGGAGSATVAWEQDGQIRVARRAAGGGAPWGNATAVVGPATTGVDIALVADVAGNVTLALTEQQNRVTARRYDATQGNWSAGRNVGALASGEPVFANDPVAAVDRSGNVTLAWFAWNREGGFERYVVSANQLR